MTDNRGFDSISGTPPPYLEQPPPYSQYPGDPAQPQTVTVSRSCFHKGARFDDPSRPSIPPPAPGYQPNEIQKMVMSGPTTVVMDTNRR